MIETKKDTKKKDFRSHIKKDVIKQARKVKGKHPAIMEVVENKPRILKIESIYDLNVTLKHFFLLLVKSKGKKSITKYLLAISLANQSSDILSELAKKQVAKGDNLKLIQYSVFPKNHRTSLLLLKESGSIEEYSKSVVLLREIRNTFRKKIIALVKKMET